MEEPISTHTTTATEQYQERLQVQKWKKARELLKRRKANPGALTEEEVKELHQLAAEVWIYWMERSSEIKPYFNCQP